MSNFFQYLSKIFSHRWTFHALFWLFFLIVFFYSAISGTERPVDIHDIFLLIFLWIGLVIPVYVNLLILIPRLLYDSQYLLYTLSTLTVISSGASLIHFLMPLLFDYAPSHYLQSFTFIGFFVIMTSGLKLYRDGIEQQLFNKEMQTKQLQAELNLLKSQVNPHFLFNTLNNLYSLTLEKSDKAPEIVLKLAEIMRYLLDSSKTEITDLEKECHFLSNYLALEKIRLNDKAVIKFEVKGDIKGVKIPPMLLIPFVENCFKHGNIGNLHVYICVEVEENNLYFYAENNKSTTENAFIEKSGIGMENIHRRLDLLFEDSYSLEIEDKQGRFVVNLHIDMQE